MNTHVSSRRTSRQPISRVAGSVPVTQLCEIACLVLCRVVVPKLAKNLDPAN